MDATPPTMVRALAVVSRTRDDTALPAEAAPIAADSPFSTQICIFPHPAKNSPSNPNAINCDDLFLVKYNIDI